MTTTLLSQVTVVCVTYNSQALIATLAESLRPFSHIVVIDNASSDETLAAVRVCIPQATVRERPQNDGFGKANNDAMRYVATPYALLLNPDCATSAEAVQTLLRTLGDYPDAGAVAPQSWLSDDVPQMSFRPAFYEPRLKTPYRVPDGTCSAKWLHGCCLLIRTEAFRTVDGFDERFFLYYEDDDLCLRLQAHGFECLFEPAANARHLGGASSAPTWNLNFFKHFHYARSRYLAITKYLGVAAGRRYLAKIMLIAPFAAFAYAVFFQRKHSVKWAAWGVSAWTLAFARTGR